MIRINIEDQKKRNDMPPIMDYYGGIKKKKNPNEVLNAGCGCYCKCPDTVTFSDGWNRSGILSYFPIVPII